MRDLNNLEEIKKLDPKDVFGSTQSFPHQCRQIWQDAKSIDFTDQYKDIKNIVVCGMGGSAYGGYIIQALFKDQLKVPIISNNDYDLPSFVDEHTLIILSSYSGTTEEVIACFEQAKLKTKKITGITSGGQLGEILRNENIPSLVFNPQFNPSGQPRLGTGYMVLGTIGILGNIGLISIPDDQVNQAIVELEDSLDDIKVRSRTLAEKLYGFIPLIFAAEFLSGNIHIIRNQFNETAKSFASYSELPELNHHLMEGLKNPVDKKLHAIFIKSDFYTNKLKDRVNLTQDVVNKNNVISSEYKASGRSKLSQMLNVLSFGGFLAFYLAMLYGQDPSLIPWVDYFKEQMEKD